MSGIIFANYVRNKPVHCSEMRIKPSDTDSREMGISCFFVLLFSALTFASAASVIARLVIYTNIDNRESRSITKLSSFSFIMVLSLFMATEAYLCWFA
jgi:hypothetical protein